MEHNLIKFRAGKALISIITLGIFLILAAVTNPSKSEYISWTKEQSLSKTNNVFEKGLTAIFAQPLLENTTLTHNYVLFSVYDTKIDNSRYVV